MHKTKPLTEALAQKNSAPLNPDFEIPALTMLWGLLQSINDPDSLDPQIQVAQFACYKIAGDINSSTPEEKAEINKQAFELIAELRAFLDTVETNLKG